jgi:peptidyl-prolyl cis-trans isomerase D
MLIQRMRDGSEGVLAKVIIGLIIIVFALFGFGSITTFLSPPARVASVHGEDVTQQQMELAVERNRRMMMARNIALEDINEDELREDVLQSLISREILKQAATDFDLYYGDESLDAELVSAEVFQIDGVFNADQFQNVIRSAGFTPLGYRDEMRTDKQFEQMLTGIRQSSFVTPGESERFSGLLSQTRDIAFLTIEVASLIDEVVVTDAEISDYYTANSAEFITDETVSLEYVELKREDLAASLDVNEADLAEYFTNTMSDYTTDESRRLAHILIESADSSLEEAASKAAEVYERIKQGDDFTALAKEYSDDLGSADNGGDLGFSEPGTFFPEFEAVAYDLALNQVSEPVETEIGYHIIKVLEIEQAVIQTLEDVRAEVEAAFRLVETEEDFVSMSSRLAELLFESEDLQPPAAELGLQIQTTAQLKRDANHPLMSIGQVATAAFSPDVLLDGNNSDLLQISEDYHVGIRVLEHFPSASKPLAAVQEDIRFILQNEKAMELATLRADEIVQAISSGSLAQYVADEYELAWEAVAAATRFQPEVDRVVLQEAFSLPRPAASKESLGAATMPNGDAIVLRISGVQNKDVSEMSEVELSTLRQGIANQIGTIDFQEFEDSLTREADLERIN